MHQCLGDVVQQCVDNQGVTAQFYQGGSLTLDSQLLPTLLSSLYQLCDVPFDLPPSGHDLDVSWPTFTRQVQQYCQTQWRSSSFSEGLTLLFCVYLMPASCVFFCV